MANYLLVVLAPTMQDWLTGLLENSIDSWGDLCAKLIENYHGTYQKPRVDWDLYQLHQKKGESLREFIRRFMKKKNSIPGVSDAVVMAAFRKGVKDDDLLKKMTRKPPTTVKELFDMADRYANQEEAMATERDDRLPQKDKKDKRDVPESSKSRDRKRKSDDMVAAADRARLPRPPRPDDYRKLME